MELFDLPIENLEHIFKYCDCETLLKLQYILKNNKIGRKFINKIGRKFISNIINNKNNNNVLFWNKIYYNNILSKINQQLDIIINTDFDRHFVTNLEYIDDMQGFFNVGKWVTKTEMFDSFSNKFVEVKNMEKDNVELERALIFIKKQHNSDKFSIINNDYQINIIEFFTEKIFNSHIENCLCRNIHEWCEGYYCAGCKHCKLLYPTHKCNNIRKKDDIHCKIYKMNRYSGVRLMSRKRRRNTIN